MTDYMQEQPVFHELRNFLEYRAPLTKLIDAAAFRTQQAAEDLRAALFRERGAVQGHGDFAPTFCVCTVPPDTFLEAPGAVRRVEAARVTVRLGAPRWIPTRTEPDWYPALHVPEDHPQYRAYRAAQSYRRKLETQRVPLATALHQRLSSTAPDPDNSLILPSYAVLCEQLPDLAPLIRAHAEQEAAA